MKQAENWEPSGRKKILFVITKSNFGGAQRYVYDLATHLLKSEYDVTVALGGNGLLKQKLDAEVIRTIPIGGLQRDISILKELRAFLILLRCIKEVRPHVVHLNSSKAAALGAFAARIAGARKIIFTVHGWPYLEERGSIWKSLVYIASWLTVLLSHRVICVSQRDYAAAPRLFISKRKYVLIHNGITPIILLSKQESRQALFASEVIDQHKKDVWVLTNAELNPNKNLATAIDAVAGYNAQFSPKIFYAIMGEGETRTKIARYIQERNCSETIVLLGYVQDGWRYIPAFDTFLLTSKKEGLPYVVLEAGRASIATIASAVGGIPEIIENGKSGIMCAPTDTEGFQEALKKLAQDPELRQSYGKQLRRRIDTEFSLDQMLEKTKILY
jgi:glycosyltransferase involved in cell wall biosynthesis